MQQEAQTTTLGFRAVSAGALEMEDRYSRRPISVLALPLIVVRSHKLQKNSKYHKLKLYALIDIQSSYKGQL